MGLFIRKRASAAFAGLLAMTEQWKPVAGFDDLYEISSLGRVRSLGRNIRLWHGGIHARKGRVLRNRYTKDGYDIVALSRDGKQHNTSVHRLVATAFVPNPADKPCVNHIDGNPSNNAAANLEWVTYSENTIHAYRTGLQYVPSGERSRMAKLSDNDVRRIRELTASGLTSRAVAKMFGVSRNHVGAIRCGIRRAEVK
jgi:hypothetical protein